ncbi:MAG: glycosyltransferase [Arenimonas sp.]
MHEPEKKSSGNETARMLKRVAIVSPYFPPSTLAGVHRARFLARHLPAAGWEPVVICVHEKHHEERLDPGLAALVPKNARVIKVDAFPSRWMRTFGVGDLSIRAYWQLRKALIHLLQTETIDCVFITAAPYYSTLLAGMVKRRFKLPVVLDFQDPWVSNWGGSLPKWSKGGIAHRLSTWLEPRAIRAADHIVSVSDGQNQEMHSRYPWLQSTQLSALAIGGDPADYVFLRDNPLQDNEVKLSAGVVNLSFVGTLMPRTGPVLEALFKAVALLRVERPELVARLRLNFIGTSNQPNGHRDFRVQPFALAAGLTDLVTETPQRVAYLEALNLLANSQGILLLGSDEPHYTASKIYPAILSGTPMLGIFHRASSAVKILRDCGNSLVIDFENADGLATLTREIARALELLVEHPEQLAPPDAKSVAPYGAQALAVQFATIFDDAARKNAEALA